MRAIIHFVTLPGVNLPHVLFNSLEMLKTAMICGVKIVMEAPLRETATRLVARHLRIDALFYEVDDALRFM